jgi:hypothetical protein
MRGQREWRRLCHKKTHNGGKSGNNHFVLGCPKVLNTQNQKNAFGVFHNDGKIRKLFLLKRFCSLHISTCNSRIIMHLH